jgi:hypothetical protein
MEYVAPMGLGVLGDCWLQRFRSDGALFQSPFAVGDVGEEAEVVGGFYRGCGDHF